MLKEFKEFALKGNMVDLAVGIVIGAAFGAIVSSLVDDVFMPIIGLLIGGVDFSQWVLFGLINIGLFINAVVKFVIIALALFLVVKGMNSMKKKEEAAPSAPPADIALLTEIRDLLKKK